MKRINVTSLVLSLSLAVSPVILAGGDKDTYKSTLPTVQESSNTANEPKAVKAPAGAVRVLPANPVVRAAKPITQTTTASVIKPTITQVLKPLQPKIAFAKPAVAAARKQQTVVAFTANTKQSEPVAQEPKKSEGSVIKGFVKLVVAAGAAALSYEFLQQGRKQPSMLNSLYSAVGMKNSFGDLVQQAYDYHQPRLFKISEQNRQLPLQFAQLGASGVCGALALTAAVSGVKDLIK